MRGSRCALLASSLLALALAGCWSVRAPGETADAGRDASADAHTGPTSDAGMDAMVSTDAGIDGSSGDDAGPTRDASIDAGPRPDGGPLACRVLDPRALSCPGGGAGCAQRVVVVIPEARGFAIGRDTDDDLYGNRPATMVMPRYLAPFEIEVDEVTVARFRRWIDAGAPSARVTLPDGTSISTMSGTYETAAMNADCAYGGADVSLPMNCVSWDAALAFCSWDVPGGRLPTDVEREYVARWWNATPAETAGRMFPWGNGAPDTCTYANVNGCGRPMQLLRVGSLATAFCLNDFGGNVAEWTIDDFGTSDDVGSLRPACWGPTPWTSPSRLRCGCAMRRVRSR